MLSKPDENKRSKASKACMDIFCPTYLASRREAFRFKITWSIISEGERVTHVLFYLLQISYFVFYLLISLIVPFVSYKPDISKEGGCKGSSSIIVYGGYAGILVLGSLLEAYIHLRLKKLFNKKNDGTTTTPEFNRFMFSAWL